MPYPGYTTARRYSTGTQLHQKDLRINLELVQILGPGNQWYLEADTNLALSLIVGFYVSRGSIMVRRVVISVKRPCRKVYKSQNVRF